MAKRNLKNIEENRLYHIFNHANGNNRLFHEDDDYKLFVNLLTKYYSKTKNNVLAYCLMPNHYHLLLQINDKELNTNQLRTIQSLYARKYNQKYGSRFHVFGERYNRILIKSDSQLLIVYRYILRNPLGKLVPNLFLYKWSSFYEIIKSQNTWLNDSLVRDLLNGDLPRLISFVTSFSEEELKRSLGEKYLSYKSEKSNMFLFD